MIIYEQLFIKDWKHSKGKDPPCSSQSQSTLITSKHSRQKKISIPNSQLQSNSNSTQNVKTGKGKRSTKTSDLKYSKTRASINIVTELKKDPSKVDFLSDLLKISKHNFGQNDTPRVDIIKLVKEALAGKYSDHARKCLQDRDIKSLMCILTLTANIDIDYYSCFPLASVEKPLTCTGRPQSQYVAEATSLANANSVLDPATVTKCTPNSTATTTTSNKFPQSGENIENGLTNDSNKQSNSVTIDFESSTKPAGNDLGIETKEIQDGMKMEKVSAGVNKKESLDTTIDDITATTTESRFSTDTRWTDMENYLPREEIKRLYKCVLATLAEKDDLAVSRLKRAISTKWNIARVHCSDGCRPSQGLYAFLLWMKKLQKTVKINSTPGVVRNKKRDSQLRKEIWMHGDTVKDECIRLGVNKNIQKIKFNNIR